MMVTGRQLVALALALTMVTTAGCAGWGTGSPAPQNESTEVPADGNASAPSQADSDGTGNNSPNEDSGDDGTDDAGEGSSSNEGDVSDPSEAVDTQSASGPSGDAPADADSDEADTAPEPEESGGSADSDDSGTNGGPGKGDGAGTDGSARDAGSKSPSGSDSTDDSGSGDESDDEPVRTAQLRVYVEDNSTGDYLTGANVTVVNRETGEEHTGTTEEGSQYYGNYVVFEDLPLGTYRISADADGYAGGSRSVELTESGRQPGIELAPESPSHTFTMNLVNAETGEPFQTPVTLTRPNGTERTHESGDDGVVRFSVGSGEYGFEIGAEGAELGMQYATTVSIEGGDVTRTYRLYPSPDDVSASITVVDAETGEPIPDATVSGVSPNLATPYGEALFEVDTDANGVAEGAIRDAINDYEVSVRADGYETNDESISAEELTDARIELAPENEERGTAEAAVAA